MVSPFYVKLIRNYAGKVSLDTDIIASMQTVTVEEMERKQD